MSLNKRLAEKSAAAGTTPSRGGRVEKESSTSRGRGGVRASKDSSPAPFAPDRFSHLQPAESGPEPVRQSRATTFVEAMCAADAAASGEEFDRATMVAGPSQKVRRVTGEDLVRVQRQMTGVS